MIALFMHELFQKLTILITGNKCLIPIFNVIGIYIVLVAIIKFTYYMYELCTDL